MGVDIKIICIPPAGAPEGRVPPPRPHRRPQRPATRPGHGDIRRAGHAILCAPPEPLAVRVVDAVGGAIAVAGEGGEGADGGGEALGVVGVEGGEVLVCGVEVGEVGEEVAGDDVGEGGGVGVFVEDVLVVQAAGAGAGAVRDAGGGVAGEERVRVGAEESVCGHRGGGGVTTGGRGSE